MWWPMNLFLSEFYNEIMLTFIFMWIVFLCFIFLADEVISYE